MISVYKVGARLGYETIYDLTFAGHPVVSVCDPFTARDFTHVDVIRQTVALRSTAATTCSHSSTMLRTTKSQLMLMRRVTASVYFRTQVVSGFKKTRVFFKAQPSGFWGFIGFFVQTGKIGKIIQKLSNLKP